MDYKRCYDHIFWMWLALIAVTTLLRSSSIMEANCSSISSVLFIYFSSSCSLRSNFIISSIFLYSLMSLLCISYFLYSLRYPSRPFQNLLTFSLDSISINLTRFLFSVLMTVSLKFCYLILSSLIWRCLLTYWKSL